MPTNIKKLCSVINKTALTFTCAALIMACGDKQADQTEQSHQHIKQAEVYTQQGQLRSAMIEARNAIQKAPQNPQAHIVMANIYLELNQSKQALEQLEQVPESARNNTHYITTQAKTLISRGKFRSALEALTSLQEGSEPESSLLKAQALHGLGQLDEAISSYQTLPETNIEAQLGLAKVYAQKEDFRNAFEVLLKLKSSAPNNPEVRFFEASLAARDGDLERTESLLTETLSLLPNTDIMTPLKSNVMRALADVLAKQGRASEALVYSKILSEAYPGSDLAQGKFKESIELFEKGQLDEAKSILTELLETYPQFEQGAQLLGIINYLQGDYEAANTYFNDNLDPETASQLAANIAAETSLKLNQPEKVMELLGTNIDKTNNPETLGLYGVAAMAAGDMEKGIDALKRSLKIKPENNRLHLLLAKHYAGINEAETALEHIKTAYETTKGKKDPLVQVTYAKHLVAMGKTKDAEALLKNILEDKPISYSAYLVAGDTEAYQGKYTAAEKHYQAALKLEPDNAPALIGYAYSSARQKKWQQALEAFTKLTTSHPTSIIGYRGILNAYSSKNDPQSGVNAVNALKKQSSENIEAYLALAEYYTGKQEYSKAYLEIDAAKAIAPSNPQLDQTTGMIAYFQSLAAHNRGDLNNAKAAAIKGLQSAPENDRLLALLISIETKLGNYSEARTLAQRFEDSNYFMYEMILGDIDMSQSQRTTALTHYQKSWNARPTDMTAQKIYSILRVDQGLEQAQTFLTEWLSKNPNSLIASTLDADNALAEENYPYAIAQLEKIISVAPNAPATLNNLAWAYYKTGDKRAVETAKRAYDLAPNVGAVADTYGWILVNDKQIKKGIEVLEKAVQLDPETKEIQDHLKEAQRLLKAQ